MERSFGLIRERISRAFQAEFSLSEKVCNDIGFHMADWLRDFEKLERVFDTSQPMTDKEVMEIVLGFLIHVPDHVAAAQKLAGVGPIRDTFNVGIFEEDEEE